MHLSGFRQNHPQIQFYKAILGLGHWVLSKNPQATADHHTQARVRFYNESRAESIFWAGFVLCCNPCLSDFHKKQLWGFKTGFGALVKGHPFAWVHTSLGSTVLPKTTPQIQFRGFRTDFGALVKVHRSTKTTPQNQFWVLKTGYLFRVTPLLGCISHWVLNRSTNSGVQNWICKRNDFRCDTKLLYMTFASETKNFATFSQLFRVVHLGAYLIGLHLQNPKATFRKILRFCVSRFKILGFACWPY